MRTIVSTVSFWTWSHLLKKLLIENFIFCAVLEKITTDANTDSFFTMRVLKDHKKEGSLFVLYLMTSYNGKTTI